MEYLMRVLYIYSVHNYLSIISIIRTSAQEL
jgi:hypothetical protein